MNKLLLTTALTLLAAPVFAKEYVIKEMSDSTGTGKKPYYYSPDKLTIQPGDTVTFLNDSDDMHDVMFVNVPKAVDEMIMSPMHNNKGDKYSYTFNVPGTYKFHCHPHEKLGMTGMLIVGQPSKIGETKVMDHHKMAKIHDQEMAKQAKADGQIQPAAGGIEATGKVNKVDAGPHTINLTHDPIKALGWPKMKMEFNVDPSVDLSSLKAGDDISFTLKAKGEDDYEVVGIHSHTH